MHETVVSYMYATTVYTGGGQLFVADETSLCDARRWRHVRLFTMLLHFFYDIYVNCRSVMFYGGGGVGGVSIQFYTFEVLLAGSHQVLIDGCDRKKLML